MYNSSVESFVDMGNNADQNILRGPEPLYEPSEGGLGYEIFRAFNKNRANIAQIMISTGESDTYEDLMRRGVRTANYFSEKGLTRGDTVCLLSENSSNTVVPLIASQLIGLKYASIEMAISEDDLMHLLRYLQPKIIFVSERFEEKINVCVTNSDFKGDVVIFGKSTRFSNFSRILESSEGVENFQPIYVENTKEEAFIFLSSGTTGKPKGICVSHYAVLAQTFNLYRYFGMGSIHFSNFSHKYHDINNSPLLCYSPLSWISCVLNTLMMFFSGGSIIFGTNFRADEAWSAMKKYKPYGAFFPPGQVNELCSYAYDKEPNNNLDAFWTGGGLVSKMHIANIKKCFPKSIATQALGLSENAGLVTAFDIHNSEELALTRNHPESCGRPVSGVQVKIVDPDNELTCGVGMQGELRLKTKYLMNAYYKMDSSLAFDSEGWFKTGDLAYFDENNCIYILDRMKDVLLYTIYNIRPSVIENILSQHPAVQESFVFGHLHPIDNEHPMGVVVLKDEYKNRTSQDEIIAFVNQKVPSDKYKIRAGIKFLDKMLKTSTGKLKKIEMKQLIMSGQL